MNRATGGLLSALVIMASAGYVYVSQEAPVVALLATAEAPDEGTDPLKYNSTEDSGRSVWYQVEREENGISVGFVDSILATVGEPEISILAEWGYGVTVRIRLRGYYWGTVDGEPRRFAGPWSDWSDPLVDSGPPPGEIPAPGLTARAVDPKVLQQ